MLDLKTQKNEENAAAQRKPIKKQQEEFNWPNSNNDKFHLLHLDDSMEKKKKIVNRDTVTLTLFTVPAKKRYGYFMRPF